MLCVINRLTAPFFNLALEEYFLKEFDEDFFILYRNDRSVITGKHQNPLAEINYSHIRKNNIIVARRLSGGGTVYHDNGNLNYSFITNGTEGDLVNFRKYTRPVIDLLKKLDVNAVLSGKSDLVINGRKFSGNAVHVSGKRVIHHGTLLFSTDISELKRSLTDRSSVYRGRRVKSVPSEVTNISDHIKDRFDVIGFRDMLMEHVIHTMPGCTIYKMSENDISEVNDLAVKKYSRWEWNFGYSPAYEVEKVLDTVNGPLKILISVNNGIISEVKAEGEMPGRGGKMPLGKLLVKTPHEEEAIAKVLASNYGMKSGDPFIREIAEKLF